MIIRKETVQDQPGVYTVNSLAFQRDDEANLVDILREAADPVISLVAEDGGRIVGHVLFSPVTIAGHPDRHVAGLGPLAVVPERQREGIGSQLVTRGLDECRKLGFGAAVVLGHPEYYPRFGFARASRFGLKCEYDVPDDVFMALELIPGYLNAASGAVMYHDAFRSL